MTHVWRLTIFKASKYTYSGEILKRSIDGKPLIYTVDVPSIDQSDVDDGFRWVSLNMPPV